jgi:nucleoside-diphosphate-sugar epimerase
LTTDPNEATPRTVSGAVNIFQSAAREPSIKSVVYTSDSWAVVFPEPDKMVLITASDYNEYAIEAAHNLQELEKIKARAWDPSVAVELIVWAAAKALAEKAVWQSVSDHQPTFQVSSVIPHMNFGPPVNGLPLSSSGKSIPDLLSTQQKPDLYFPAQHFVNVRDCAKLHVAALLDQTQAGKRVFTCAAPFNWNDVLRILREARPNATIREDFQDLGRDLSEMPRASTEMLLRKWYGHGWTDLDETVRQNIAGL